MELMNQPFTGQLGDRLIDLLDSPDYHTLNIAVAFAKNSGVLRIKDALEKFRQRGGKVNVYVGVDLGGTSYEALIALMRHTDTLNVVHSESGQTFHSKIYQFFGEKNGFLVVGSHNLTGGGLWTNFESSLHIPTDQADANSVEILSEVNDYFEQLARLGNSLMLITNQDEIEKLLDKGYVTKEVTDRIRRASAEKKDGSRERLFGNGATALLPRLKPSEGKVKLEAVAPTRVAQVPTKAALGEVDDLNQTIWFETRQMTGGSRNILDLSKKSLIERGDPVGTPFDVGDPKFMRGGVEFFGLDPNDTEKVADITINFEGQDYSGNTILYPEGDNANGTWRLQIKGQNSSGEKITEAFRSEGEVHLLVEKVVTFTKVSQDYYYLSVFPASSLEEFQQASSILARNGSNRRAKFLGLL